MLPKAWLELSGDPLALTTKHYDVSHQLSIWTSDCSYTTSVPLYNLSYPYFGLYPTWRKGTNVIKNFTVPLMWMNFYFCVNFYFCWWGSRVTNCCNTIYQRVIRVTNEYKRPTFCPSLDPLGHVAQVGHLIFSASGLILSLLKDYSNITTVVCKWVNIAKSAWQQCSLIKLKEYAWSDLMLLTL